MKMRFTKGLLVGGLIGAISALSMPQQSRNNNQNQGNNDVGSAELVTSKIIIDDTRR